MRIETYPGRKEYVTREYAWMRMTTCMKCGDAMPHPQPGVVLLCLLCREPWRRI